LASVPFLAISSQKKQQNSIFRDKKSIKQALNSLNLLEKIGRE
jgi:hypothetical protein